MNASPTALEHAVQPHRLTVAEYVRMAEVGIIAPDARVELINGVIYDMPPIDSPHAGAVNLLTEALVLAAIGRAVVTVQNPIILGEHSSPQPDIALVRWRDDRYRERHPETEDILLLIEVSDSSLSHDRRRKLPLYARFGVPAYWIVDVQSTTITEFTQPGVQTYAIERIVPTDAPITLPGLDGVIVDLQALTDP